MTDWRSRQVSVEGMLTGRHWWQRHTCEFLIACIYTTWGCVDYSIMVQVRQASLSGDRRGGSRSKEPPPKPTLGQAGSEQGGVARHLLQSGKRNWLQDEPGRQSPAPGAQFGGLLPAAAAPRRPVDPRRAAAGSAAQPQPQCLSGLQPTAARSWWGEGDDAGAWTEAAVAE